MSPLPVNDRDRSDVSEMQTGFIKIVILPLYSVLSTMFPQLQILVENINVNIQCWIACKPFLEEERKKNIHTMEILESEAVKNIIYEILTPYRNEQKKSELSINSTMEEA